MSRGTVNTILLIALAGTIGLNWFGPPDLGRRNFEYFPNMTRSARYNGFAPNPNFPEGKTLQQPVPGTIPRGFHPLHLVATKEDAIRAGEVLLNPMSDADAQAVNRGRSVFTNFCQPCHGSSGRGDGPVTLRGFPAPPSLLAERARDLRDGQLFHILSVGQGNMPSYAAQVSQADRWKVILYLRMLQKESGQAQLQASSRQPAQPRRRGLGRGASGGRP